MEEGKAAMAQQQQHQHQQQLMQQQLLLQQIQRQKDAMSRFPSNIDAHLRPQHPILQHRPMNPSSAAALSIIPNQLHPNPNPNPNPASGSNSSVPPANNNNPQQQQHKASLQLAYQDAWRVCHPDFRRPFSSLEDACERLLPYHVVADYEAEEDDKILDSATTGQVLSRSQQWDHNIAAKVAEFTATFEKQVLAFNIISRKRGLGEFRTEEKLLMEQALLNEEKRALMGLRAEMELRQKANREAHDANARMAATMVHVEQTQAAESQAHAEMMARGPIRASALGARGGEAVGHDAGEPEQDFQQDDIMNGWGSSSAQRDERAPSEDFLNDDDTENGDAAGTLQGEWPGGGGELDLNAR